MSKLLILFFCCQVLINWNCSAQSTDSSIIAVKLFDKNYFCFDSLASDRLIDSTIQLKLCREIILLDDTIINQLQNEVKECIEIGQNKSKVINLQEDKISLLNDEKSIYLKDIQKAKKKLKTSKFIGSFSIIAAFIGGILIGKL